jgi:formylglycine-generating enzyme required for sulfatase activity
MKTFGNKPAWILLAAALATGCARHGPGGDSDKGSRQAAHETPAAGPAEDLPPSMVLDLGRDIRMELVLVRPGSFQMGDAGGADDAQPVHTVAITQPFYLGKYKVTQQQWEAVMGNNPSYFKGPQNPVDNVGWDACQRFLKKLGEKCNPGWKCALPNEAQWEYACRAGSSTKYCYGDDESRLAEYAWFSDNSKDRTHPVGEKKPNAWGLYDVHGSLFEWCADWYAKDCYKASPPSDPAGPAAGTLHVDRGGSWRSLAGGCRCGFRNNNSPRPDFLIGLRVMCVRAPLRAPAEG